MVEHIGGYQGVLGVVQLSENRRSDPTLNSWQSALLNSIPTSRMLIASEVGDGTAYRPLLLEMEIETGTNHHKTLTRVFGGRTSAADKRRGLIDEPCWLDVMANKQPTWKKLGEVLHLSRGI